MSNILKLKAKAIVAVRKRKKLEEEERLALEARERAIEQRLLATLTQRIPKDGKDAVAPSMDAILAELIPLIPESTHTTVVQEVNPTDRDVLFSDMENFIKGLLPEIQPEDRPKVEQITNTIDVSDEKLEGFVTQKEFKKTLQKIQDAITASQGGGSGSRGDLVNVIQVFEDTTITQAQLLADKYNVILVMTAGITVTLPAETGTKVVEIKQGFVGTGTYTICKETS